MASQDMLGKVRGLIDTAESYEAQGNREAASTYRAKAEELMVKYRIQEEETLAQDPASIEPVFEEIVLVSGGSALGEFRQQYVDMFWAVSKHAGVRVHYRLKTRDESYALIAETVGYEGDLRYAEMLFTAARLVFGNRLEPKVDPARSEQENVYRLRSAGMERVRVADAVFGNREKSSLGKVGRMYKAECAKRNEKPALDGRGVTGKVYREQYAQEFVYAFYFRLRQAQDAAGNMGGGLVLHGRQERVDEAFYERFPSYRPSGEAVVTTPEECVKCKTTKHESGKCRDHRPRALTESEKRAARRYSSPAAVRGRQAGQTAAREVELHRGRTAKVERQAPEGMIGQ